MMLFIRSDFLLLHMNDNKEARDYKICQRFGEADFVMDEMKKIVSTRE
jgi:hypothetical protein